MALTISVRGIDVELTDNTLQATRQWFHDNALQCRDDAIAGVFTVNNLAEYISWCEKNAKEALEIKDRHSFTFIQRAYYMQSGECVPLLSK